MIKYNFEFTISKVAGLICIFAGIAMIFTGQAGYAVSAMTVGSALIGVKTVVGGKKV